MNNQEPRTKNEEPGNAALTMPEDVVLSVRGVSKKFCRNLRRSMWYGVQDLSRNLVGRGTRSGIRDPGLALRSSVGGAKHGYGMRDAVTSDSEPNTPNNLERAEGEASDNQEQGTKNQEHAQNGDGLRPSEFWALKNISFDLRRGEVLGLIGVNGSGKTTLLRLIAGIFPPDAGEIAIRGRVGALIALGAGFHPHLTGRENIYLNAAILGLHRDEIEERFQAIIDFAEIGEFIDAPVSTYSSGMRVKLGFAIAINVKADLLLIDEVLAVGDMGFRIKCLNAVRQLMDQTAVIFVSHVMQMVSQFCTRIVVMDKGVFTCDASSIEEGIDRYLSQFPTEVTVAGTGGAVIDHIQLHTKGRSWRGEEEATVLQGEELDLLFDVKILDPECSAAHFIVHIMDQGLDPLVVLVAPECSTLKRAVSPGLYRIRIGLGIIDFNAGKYSLVISVEDADSRIRLVRLQGVGQFRVISNLVHWGRVVRPSAMLMDRV